MSEFALIENYLNTGAVKRKDVVVGIGDDCAIVQAAPDKQIVVTTDTLVSGVHFLPEASPRAIAHKALAVNLSDLAAMGAEPCWVSLALTMPEADENWLAEFSASFHELAEYFGVQLIGGDTTRGPLSVTVTAQGQVPENKATLRSGANPGDLVYVTGELGDAALGLQVALGNTKVAENFKTAIAHRLDFPTPRLLAGQSLRGVASAAIDLSDGLISDLQHILQRSGVGATISLEDLPFSKAMAESVELSQAEKLALSGGDDYELLFTVSQDSKGALKTALANSGVSFTCIGQINAEPGELTFTRNGESVALDFHGYQHFDNEA